MGSSSNEVKSINKEKMWNTVPPEGWFTPDEVVEIHLTTLQDEADQDFVLISLPKATEKAEKLVEDIERKTGIIVPESYMRVANDTCFHFLLLVDAVDYRSPGMSLASIIADEHTRVEERFDIHFSFSVNSEFAKRSQYNADEYSLKRMNSFE